MKVLKRGNCISMGWGGYTYRWGQQRWGRATASHINTRVTA